MHPYTNTAVPARMHAHVRSYPVAAKRRGDHTGQDDWVSSKRSAGLDLRHAEVVRR